MRADVDLLFRSNRAALHRYVYRQIGDGADDIVSATFELAYARLPAAHPEPTGWLFHTARNLIRSELRRQRREHAAFRDAALLPRAEDGLSDVEVIRMLIGQLSPAHREVLQLTYWDQLTAAQTGIALGCSERAVWKRISRAKAALRDSWQRTDPRNTVEVNRDA